MLTLEPELLPQSLVEKCAAISVRPDAIKQLVESMQGGWGSKREESTGIGAFTY